MTGDSWGILVCVVAILAGLGVIAYLFAAAVKEENERLRLQALAEQDPEWPEYIRLWGKFHKMRGRDGNHN